MEYEEVVRIVLNYLQSEDKSIINSEKFTDLLGIERKVECRKYIRKMIGKGLLSVGPDFYMRNDDVYKLKFGNEIYILRSENEAAIALNEWISCVENDNDLQLDGFAEASNPIGEHVRIENEGLSLWIKHSWEHKVWFNYVNGKIIVKNPDQETIRKMFEIAKKKKAVVKNQGGDLYGEDGFRKIG